MERFELKAWRHGQCYWVESGTTVVLPSNQWNNRRCSAKKGEDGGEELQFLFPFPTLQLHIIALDKQPKELDLPRLTMPQGDSKIQT